MLLVLVQLGAPFGIAFVLVSKGAGSFLLTSCHNDM